MSCMQKYEAVGSILCKNSRIVTSAALMITGQRRNLVFMHVLAIFEKLMGILKKAL